MSSDHARELVVVTNSLAIATVLGGAAGVELHVIGGTFLHRQAVLLGSESLRALDGWKFDAAVLGGEGMDASGLSNSHAAIATFQNAVIARAPLVLFGLDATKLGRSTPFPVTTWLDSFHLISDAKADELSTAGINLPADRRHHAR